MPYLRTDLRSVVIRLHNRCRATLLVPAALLTVSLGVPSPALGAGATPSDPILFDVATGSIPLTIASGAEVWLRARFVPSSSASHLTLETEGSLDTELAVYANLSEALQDLPLAEDDNGGPRTNASVRVPLGFQPPYLVRVRAARAGSSLLRGELSLVASGRCDWPAGCSLAAAAQGEPTAAETIRLLRQVRDEVLSQSQRGRDLIDLYWRLGADLIPVLLTDGDFRQRSYREITELLPLGREAVDVARSGGTGIALSRADLERLQRLVSLLLPRLAPDLADELRAQWAEFALDRYLGQPLATALAETALLPAARSYTVIAKLRTEPSSTTGGGAGPLRIADAALDARLAAAGVTTIRRVHAPSQTRRAAELTRTIAFEVEGLAAARDLVAQLQSHPSIEWAEVSATLWALAPTGADPFRNDLWGLDAVRAPRAWPLTPGTCSTRVAVVDTGLRAGLADLEGRLLHQLGYDFADDDPDPRDEHGHGTHVAGTIASAMDNATSIAGVAPGVCVFGVKVLGDDGSGTSEDVAAGIVHAVDSGARVINLSLGCDCEVLRVIEDALGYASARDVVVVAAAGNDGVDELFYPASSPRTIAVAAVDQDLELASFSNFGAGLDLAAPGVDVVSLFRDGESCMGSGTSMATPHVAGVAALVRSIVPGLDSEGVRTLLREEAIDLGAPGYDTRFGAGLVDAFGSVSRAAGSNITACVPSSTGLCLADGRFQVETFWRRNDGTAGQGRAQRLTPNTGYFWFFNSANVEMVVKVLDACSAPSNRFWVFAGGLTNVEVRTRVTDTSTGAVREYLNPQGRAFQPIQDTSAFATCQGGFAADETWSGSGSAEAVEWITESSRGELEMLTVDPAQYQVGSDAGPVPHAAASGTCTESPTALCLENGRFRVETFWRRNDGTTGQGRAVRLTPNTGYFWFFNSANVEMVTKVLNACNGPRRYWVFAGGLTNVQVRTRVTDTRTGAFKEYVNPQGRAFQPIQDTGAFATCP